MYFIRHQIPPRRLHWVRGRGGKHKGLYPCSFLSVLFSREWQGTETYESRFCGISWGGDFGKSRWDDGYMQNTFVTGRCFFFFFLLIFLEFCFFRYAVTKVLLYGTMVQCAILVGSELVVGLFLPVRTSIPHAMPCAQRFRGRIFFYSCIAISCRVNYV